ncbi:stage VI sporulation protein F [Aquibacillus halophilus]|uniref:Stage VI sporulation protein F n=1 Tax=Aquibacillus halophilus TaxID=930132 RepID=A0A6A8D6L5_9BACI|nr:stage VI sporulation protein F [Aquibacillus halophilus]MRH41405.1 stage VI sporulation protein F [Aquibacillus halophilus]
MNQDMFKNVEKKTGVDMQSISKVANSFNGKNVQDENTARQLVRQVGKLAGKKVPKETEDMIVKMLSNGKGINESSIKKMIK